MHGKRATRERRQCANRVCGGVFVHWELMWQCRPLKCMRLKYPDYFHMCVCVFAFVCVTAKRSNRISAHTLIQTANTEKGVLKKAQQDSVGCSGTAFNAFTHPITKKYFLALPYPITRIVDENTHSTTICVEIHNISNVKYALHTTRTHICTHIRIIPQLQCPSVSIYNIVARCDVSVMHKWARVCPSNLNRVGWQWCARTLVWGTITMLMMIEYGVAGVGATTAQS